MIKSSEQYRKSIIADYRRIFIKAIIDIADPDITYGTTIASNQSPYSKPEQLHNKDFSSLQKLASLELNRWVLDGKFGLYPNSASSLSGEVGLESDQLSDSSCAIYPEFYVEQPLSNVSILQAVSVFFSENPWDGYAVDFTVEVKQGGTTYYKQEFIGNQKTGLSMSGFTVHNPDAIRVTVKRWSLPYRRVRMVEIVPGLYEKWDGDMISEFSVRQQGDISCLSIPYGTATIRIDNRDKRFEPRKKDGIFQSIEDRQSIPLFLGVELEDGNVDYKQVGVYYQYSGGWKTGDNGITMQWNLVDIVGLLSGREFILPETLPTTLDGWINVLLLQLGDNFSDRYVVDPQYANITVKADTPDDVRGLKCGDILRYICMATGTWPRADAETGYLAVEPLWNEGDKLTLDNMNSYPVMKSNADISSIVFTLHDGNNTQYVVSGNSTASNETRSVDNPFIHNQAQALSAAKMILATFGGNRLELIGRGNMASEIGDVDTVWLDESTATTARRIQQTFSISDGVLQGCTSVLLQSDGSYLFQERVFITQSGTWSAPAGVTSLRVILVGKGGNGTDGTDGTWDTSGENGEDGLGGKVWSGTIQINSQQTFQVQIGDETTFGAYSSANGHIYPYGYTDIASGESFGRSGVKSPISGFGDGGAGGVAGVKGNRHEESRPFTSINGDTGEIISEGTMRVTIVDNYPGKGELGINGASGGVVIYYDK